MNPILKPQTLIRSLIYTDFNKEVKSYIVSITVIPTELRAPYRTQGSILYFCYESQSNMYFGNKKVRTVTYDP